MNKLTVEGIVEDLSKLASSTDKEYFIDSCVRVPDLTDLMTTKLQAFEEQVRGEEREKIAKDVGIYLTCRLDTTVNIAERIGATGTVEEIIDSLTTKHKSNN